jgi:hypothetical protein
MIAQCCVWAILHFTGMLPLCWLAGKMHKISSYKWGAWHMDYVLNVFYQKLLLIQQSPSLFVSPMFMTSFFFSIEEMLPPFVDYLDATFMRKGCADVTVVSWRCTARIMSMKKARDEMFDPKSQTKHQYQRQSAGVGEDSCGCYDSVHVESKECNSSKLFQSLALPCLLSTAEMISY